MMSTARFSLLPALAAALCLAGFAGSATAGETSFRTIEHRTVTGYRTGHHAHACPPGQYRAHGACYPRADRREDRYNARYRHSYTPHRGYLHRFDYGRVHIPYRHVHRHYHGPYRHRYDHGYRWGIYLDLHRSHRHRW